MPGGRPITGSDVRATLERFGPPGADLDELRRRVPEDAVYFSYEELARAYPPEAAGLSSGLHVALFQALFNEFE
jgi:hypothetical protein